MCSLLLGVEKENKLTGMMGKDDWSQGPLGWQVQACSEDSLERFALAGVSHTLERKIFWNIWRMKRRKVPETLGCQNPEYHLSPGVPVVTHVVGVSLTPANFLNFFLSIMDYGRLIKVYHYASYKRHSQFQITESHSYLSSIYLGSGVRKLWAKV